MKQLIQRAPFATRIVAALLLGAGAIMLSQMVYNVVPIRPYFPLLGEVLLVLATWLLYRTDNQPLVPLGLLPNFRNLKLLVLGLVIGGVAVWGSTTLRTLYTGEVWHVTTAVDGWALAKSLYFILPSVVVQELMFRGYLFTKSIARWGVVRANVLFALLFMLVHVLDRDVLQQPAQALFLAICIPVGHLWFATGLLRTGSLLFAIGLHWGNNWAVTHLAGNADTMQTIFYLTNQKLLTTWPPFIVIILLFNASFLLVTWTIWRLGKKNLPVAGC
jgi:membrane protease YdiL (CAAX protease family)